MMIDNVFSAEVLYKTCSLLIKAQDNEGMFDELVKHLVSSLKAVGCSIWMAAPDGGVGQERLAYYQSPEQLNDSLPNMDFQSANYAIEKNSHFLLHPVKGDARFDEVVTDNLLATVLPLITKNELTGALCLWHCEGTVDNTDKETFYELVRHLAAEISYGLYNYKHYSDISQKRLKKELEVASRIQMGLVPKEIPKVKGVTAGIRTMAANQVGGDYVDMFLTASKNVGIAIGDVMGKGVPAALWMAMTRVAMRTAAKDDTQPHIALQEVNSVLYPDLSRQEMFVTLFYALYDPGSKVLLFANAGHLPPLLYHSTTGQYQFLKIKGAYIGGVENKKYKMGAVQLGPGDIVLFYTDGVTEAINAQHLQYGSKRVVDVIGKNALFGAQEIADSLSIHLGQFIGDYRQTDDITFAVLKIES